MKFEFGFFGLQTNSVFLLLWYRQSRCISELKFEFFFWLGPVCEIEVFFRGLC